MTRLSKVAHLVAKSPDLVTTSYRQNQSVTSQSHVMSCISPGLGTRSSNRWTPLRRPPNRRHSSKSRRTQLPTRHRLLYLSLPSLSWSFRLSTFPRPSLSVSCTAPSVTTRSSASKSRLTGRLRIWKPASHVISDSSGLPRTAFTRHPSKMGLSISRNGKVPFCWSW